MLLLASCAGQEAGQAADENGSAASEQTTATTGGSQQQAAQPDSETTASPADMSSQERTDEAQRLLRAGDFEGAISILEQMSATVSSGELTGMLIEAHLGYADQIAENTTVDPRVLNDIRYQHYMRVIELDPENTEVLAGMMSVRVWYEANNAIPPREIDPLIFLPTQEDEADEDADGVADSDSG